MSAKKMSYGQAVSEAQKLDKKNIMRTIIFILVGIVLLAFIIMIAKSVIPKKQQTEPTLQTKPETPSLSSTSLSYWTPENEDTVKNVGADFIVINQNGQNLRIDKQGNVEYVDDDGYFIREAGDATTDATIATVLRMMETDPQVSSALFGLEQQTEETPKTDSDRLTAILAQLGIAEQDFLTNMERAGYSLDEVYSLIQMASDNPSGLIKSIYEQGIMKEDPIVDDKAIAIKVEQIGGNNPITDEPEPTSNYPSWLENSTSDMDSTMNALMTTLQAAVANPTSSTNWEQTNNQQAKSDWVENQQNVEITTGRINEYDLVAGTMIPITMVSGINTDMPGQAIGLVRQNIYDTLTGKNILIPKGSRVFANYNSSVSFGQKSVQVAWTQLITPDGYVFNLPGFQGTSTEGYTGVQDQHKSHFFQILGGALLGSIINYAAGITNDAVMAALADGTPIGEIISASGQIATNTTASFLSQYTTQWMTRQPTNIIRTGSQVQMMVNRTFNLRRTN